MNTVITAGTFFLHDAGLVSGDFGPPTRATLLFILIDLWPTRKRHSVAEGMAERRV